MISWKPRASSLNLLPCIAGLAIGSLFYGYPAAAQSIVRDSAATLVNGGDSCSGFCPITGGTTTGSSLFHSFQRFKIDRTDTVIFDDPGVENIIGQVTTLDPANISTIDGILAVVDLNTGRPGDANLFLLNPNGIIFGKNADLRVAGSFIASTAENVVFDSDIINSGDPNIVPLLTLSTPVGLQLGANSGNITINSPTRVGSSLARVGGFHGQTLAFVGRNVNLRPGAIVQVADLAVPGGGGAIHLQASENLSITDATVENALFGSGDGSNRVILKAPTINLSGGTQVTLASNNADPSAGELGQIDVTADTFTFDATNASRQGFILAFSLENSTIK